MGGGRGARGARGELVSIQPVDELICFQAPTDLGTYHTLISTDVWSSICCLSCDVGFLGDIQG